MQSVHEGIAKRARNGVDICWTATAGRMYSAFHAPWFRYRDLPCAKVHQGAVHSAVRRAVQELACEVESWQVCVSSAEALCFGYLVVQPGAKYRLSQGVATVNALRGASDIRFTVGSKGVPASFFGS